MCIFYVICGYYYGKGQQALIYYSKASTCDFEILQACKHLWVHVLGSRCQPCLTTQSEFNVRHLYIAFVKLDVFIDCYNIITFLSLFLRKNFSAMLKGCQHHSTSIRTTHASALTKSAILVYLGATCLGFANSCLIPSSYWWTVDHQVHVLYEIFGFPVQCMGARNSPSRVAFLPNWASSLG